MNELYRYELVKNKNTDDGTDCIFCCFNYNKKLCPGREDVGMLVCRGRRVYFIKKNLIKMLLKELSL
jgi:hypothetical protein